MDKELKALGTKIFYRIKNKRKEILKQKGEKERRNGENMPSKRRDLKEGSGKRIKKAKKSENLFSRKWNFRKNIKATCP